MGTSFCNLRKIASVIVLQYCLTCRPTQLGCVPPLGWAHHPGKLSSILTTWWSPPWWYQSRRGFLVRYIRDHLQVHMCNDQYCTVLTDNNCLFELLSLLPCVAQNCHICRSSNIIFCVWGCPPRTGSPQFIAYVRYPYLFAEMLMTCMQEGSSNSTHR